MIEWYPWIVLIHVIGAFGFVFAHGASAFAADRMRASTVSGTTTPGTSFARNSAFRADTSGQIPATIGMRTCAIESTKRSSCSTSNTGCVIAYSAPASTFHSNRRSS